MDEKQNKINFVKNVLLKKIIEKNDDLRDLKFVSSEVDLPPQLDGFMSAILTANLVMESTDGLRQEHSMIVKLMKGSVDFRTTSKSYEQFSNEVLMYSTVIPTLQEFLDKHNVSTVNSKEWIPRVYYADYGIYPDLSDGYESILALQNLKPLGFGNGPRLELDEEHLLMLLNTIADFHSVQYAMRISEESKLNELKSKLMPLPFEEPDGSFNIYSAIYNVAFDRYFEYYDRSPELHSLKQFNQDVSKLREKFGKAPVKLLENFRNDDPVFNVILHGDYNRNNILFDYGDPNNFADLKRIRMIDFQEVRYGSPACDLTFFMYFNMNPDLYDVLWDKLLDHYHNRIIDNITKILQISLSDKKLEKYSKENFLKHFAKFAFYGVMLSIHFLPWMMCPEDECDKLSSLFEKDMRSKEFYTFTMIVGGDSPNVKMTKAFQHASKKGYTGVFDN